MQETKDSLAIDDICKTSGQGGADLRAAEEEEEEEELQLGRVRVITFCSKNHVFTVRKICDSQFAGRG